MTAAVPGVPLAPGTEPHVSPTLDGRADGRPCAHPHCYFPDTACELGETAVEACPFWRGGGVPGAQAAGVGDGGSDGTTRSATGDGPEAGAGATWRPAWSASAFGAADLELVAARGRPRLVALVGPHDAGKTTLLGATYLALTRAGRIGDDRFAGSYTLGGWEAVSHNMRWRPGVPPTFPPHTPSGAGRAPGLLHLALRRPDGGLTDLLVTDAPGEWFTRWASDRAAADAAGARWVVRHADAFVLALDSAALAGPDRGAARSRIALLAQRLSAEAAGRPVAAVWTKADVAVPPGLRQGVVDALDRFLPGVPQFAVSVPPRARPAGANPAGANPAGVAGSADASVAGAGQELVDVRTVLAWGVAAAGAPHAGGAGPLSDPAGRPSDLPGDGPGGRGPRTPVDPFLAFRVRPHPLPR